MPEESYTLGALAGLLNATLHGDGDCRISGLASLREAKPGQLSFLSNPAYARQLERTRASAVILEPRFAGTCPTNSLLSDHPYVTFARATQLFDKGPAAAAGIHASAVVDPDATLGVDISIAANAVIGTGARIGDRTVIGAGCIIGEDSVIGADSRLHANVTLYHGVVLGDRVEIHSGAVIGADGFGFASDGTRSFKIAQLGGVIIGSDVEIGAGATIDRGALENTVVGDGVKIDNQVQIGHNCKIGRHTIICGCTAIAGSAEIGEYCVLGGASGMVGHIRIADRVKISAMSLVSQSISEPGLYSSGTGLMDTVAWKRNIVRFRELDDLSRRLKKLEKIAGQLIKQEE